MNLTFIFNIQIRKSRPVMIYNDQRIKEYASGKGGTDLGDYRNSLYDVAIFI